MWLLDYYWQLGRDNLAWAAFIAGLVLLPAPYRAWALLRNNRPGRSSGWKMWLADRYIQIWLARRPLPSGQTKYEYAMPTGFNGTVHEHAMTQKTIDEKLEKYLLVSRTEGGNVYARRDWFLFPHNWMVCVLCKWYLIVFLGDSPKWYEEISAPVSATEKAVRNVLSKIIRKILEIAFLIIILLAMLLFMRIALLPIIKIYSEFAFKHLSELTP